MSSHPPLIIAIDGPSASGKGTIARRLASHFNLPYLDTGLLYRFVALALQKQNKAPDDLSAAILAAKNLKQNISSEDFSDPLLRSHAISQPSSVVAAMPEVRAELIELQRDFANQVGGAVLDGRDIGTVIAPHAQVKIFITASPEKRAERRYKELMKGLQNNMESITYEAVLEDLVSRDARDASRITAPSKAAADAVTLDTSDLDVEAAFAAGLKIVNEKAGII